MNIIREIAAEPLTANHFISVEGFQEVPDIQPAREAYLVADRVSHAGSLVGVVYTIKGQNYYVPLKGGKLPEDADRLAAEAKQVDEVWNGARRTRAFETIKDKLVDIPAERRELIVASLSSALQRDCKPKGDPVPTGRPLEIH